ncbi:MULTISPECIES: hypothetical protein [Mycolicibacter]|uniref:DNA-binding protein n=1 Tax=Mycolicibacter arupensis TaxID=342002 RepID=A0A5C7Y794_9MYCO|nr:MULTISPECIES: hypothetical protein [Mycolicibacter]TXI57855.1 MAG: DNA-binding protein [Mycolicibacter arupensis]
MTLDELPEVMTAKQLGEYLQTTEAALAQDRYLGRGVPFVKVTSGRVRYLREDVRAHLHQNRRQRTDGEAVTA